MLRAIWFWLVISLGIGAGCAGVQADSRAAPAAVRQAVGDFALRDLKGRKVRLQDFRGKVVLLAFWATWCEPCHTELPVLQEIWERHRGRGFELVSINADPADGESTVRQMVHRYRYGFPVLLDQETEVSNRFNPTMDLPYSVLVDQDGRINAVHQGYRMGDEVAIEQKILKLLAR